MYLQQLPATQLTQDDMDIYTSQAVGVTVLFYWLTVSVGRAVIRQTVCQVRTLSWNSEKSS